MVVLYAYKTNLNTDLHGDKFEKHLFRFSTLKWHLFPDGGSWIEGIKGMCVGLYWITQTALQITVKAHFASFLFINPVTNSCALFSAGLYWKSWGVCGQCLWTSRTLRSWRSLLVCHSLLFHGLHVSFPQGVQVQQLLSHQGTVHNLLSVAIVYQDYDWIIKRKVLVVTNLACLYFCSTMQWHTLVVILKYSMIKKQ